MTAGSDSPSKIFGGSVDDPGEKGFSNDGRIVECSEFATHCSVLLSAIEKDGQMTGLKDPNPGIILNNLQGNRSADRVTHDEVKDMDDGQKDTVPMSLEGSSEVVELEAEVPPCNFLIRVPIFEDEKLIEQIKDAQLQLDEKIKCRHAIGAKIREHRAILKVHFEAFMTANLEYLAAKKLVRSKRPEIQSILCLIKNAIALEDIDIKKIEENHLIEVLNKDREIEERLKNLSKEVDVLKDNESKAKEEALTILDYYEEEDEKGKELKAQFEAADEVCQQAYKHLNTLNTLKKRLYNKNKYFHMYKNIKTLARNFAPGGDKASLHRLCANQVEIIMKEWNTNDEFRKHYISRIRPSTPDETLSIMEPVSVVSKVEQGENNLTLVSLNEKMKDKEEEKTLVEADSKEDELRKQEMECKLKEQILYKEKRKANKAMEKKKRNAEKAQKLAQLQAQKEAELKEKAKEMRLKKKKRKIRGVSSTGTSISTSSNITSTGTDTSTTTCNDNSSINDEDTVKPNETEKTNQKPEAVVWETKSRRWCCGWLATVLPILIFIFSNLLSNI